MNRHENRLTLERLESLLEAYGGDFSRWPAGLVGDAAALVVQSPEARLKLAEAQALDRLLDEASGVDVGRVSNLAERILAAAAGERDKTGGIADRDAVGHRPPQSGALIVRLPVSSRKTPAVVASGPMARRDHPRRFGGVWRAGAALAASLVLGIAIGLTDLVPDSTWNVASLLQGSTSEAEFVLSGLQIDSFAVVEEDQI